MIRVNEKIYYHYDKTVCYSSYEWVQGNVKTSGTSPSIVFYIEQDNLFISLETVYDSSFFSCLKLNIKTDITEYLSDLGFEDEKGWLSFITNGKYHFYLTKIGDNLFQIDFFYISFDGDDEIKVIQINDFIHIQNEEKRGK